MSLMDIRSGILYKFLFRPSLSRCSIGTSIHLAGSNSEVLINFEDLKQISITKGLFFNSLIFDCNNGASCRLNGLSSQTAQKGRLHICRKIFQHKIDKKWPRIETAHKEWRSLLNSLEYVTHSMYQKWKSKHHDHELSEYKHVDILELLDKDRAAILMDLQEISAKGRELIDERNDSYVLQELSIHRRLFDEVEKYSLTQNQRMAVLHDEDCNLIVAGAGTGKTSTIMAKVGYLLKKGLVSTDEILLLAFTRKAALEMRERIESKYKTSLNVRTFHALGLEIIGQTTGKKPSLSKEAEDEYLMRDTLKKFVEDLLKYEHFKKKYISFQTYYSIPYQPIWNFATLAEYTNYLRSNNIRALNGVRVKSFEECTIANWLYVNGIKFEYEAPYEIDVASREHRQYRPDFHLPDHNIYIEHFAVNKKGETPPFIDKKHYTAQMAWKRQIHQINQTRLIETYSWQQNENVLVKELERDLREAGVFPRPIPDSEVLNRINELGQMDPFIKLLATFQGLLKSSGYQLTDILNKVKVSNNTVRIVTFLEILESVIELYESRNQQRGEIDFNDMIALATDCVANGRYRSPFKYIIVDEFQDIASGRARLLIALRDQVPGSRLFCVGDDWQSIYRFTGSDISLMTQFHLNFGYTKRTDLDRTFRFNNKIEHTSTHFILKNPNQLNKNLKPHNQTSEPSVFLYLKQRNQDTLGDILAEINQYSNDRESVFVLARYNFQIPTSDAQESLIAKFPHLKISFNTVHSSKGLEADYVIVDKLNSGRYGFPTEITDDPIIDLILPVPDRYANGEERRLFYVAVTRARKKVYLISDPTSMSSFVNELRHDKHYDISIRGDVGGKPSNCPSCDSGLLIPRTNEATNSLFYGCSNYPLCSYAEDACPKCRRGPFILVNRSMLSCIVCGHKANVCKRCGRGRMVKRHGKYGEFYGCTMYSSEILRCSYTEKFNTFRAH